MIEKPAQQAQWQKGEQSSALLWSCGSVVLVISDFALPSLNAVPASAHGITLSAKTRKAIMRATNFMRCEGKPSGLLKANQKLSPCCRAANGILQNLLLFKATKQKVLDSIVWRGVVFCNAFYSVKGYFKPC